MRILIVEDESPTAEDLAEIIEDYYGKRITSLQIECSLQNAAYFLEHKEIDLLLLDLNLNGKDGFELLKELSTLPFLTIVVSANTDRAVEAFEYGVLDFIPKPYTLERIKKALLRFENGNDISTREMKYLCIRNRGKIDVVSMDQVAYFKAAYVYVEVHLESGEYKLMHKTLDKLSLLLSEHFIRVHRSYLVDIRGLKQIHVHGGGKYEAELSNGEKVPINRSTYKKLKGSIK